MQIKKRMLLPLILLAVLIPTALGALVLSNLLSSTFTLSSQPFIVAWVGDNPNAVNMLKNNQYVYNISVHNVSPDVYTFQNSTLKIKIIPPSPINDAASASRSIWLLQCERNGNLPTLVTPSTVGTELNYMLTLPSEFSFGNPINPGQTVYVVIKLTFADTAPVGQYNIQASVSSW